MLIRALPAIGLYRLLATCLLATYLLAACAPAPEPEPEPAPSETPTPVTQATPPDDRVSIIFLGDSLTAGYGLDSTEAFPALIQQRLEADGHAVRVVNAGVSGDTTAGGLSRLDWLLRQQPDILMVCLGANDGLRGVELASSESNLRAIVERALAQDIRVLMAGMLIPPNYGQDYTDRFAEIYPRLAEELGVPLIPFLLEGVAAHPELNLPDGIHPNAEGQKIVAETVYPYVRELVSEESTIGG